MGDLRFRAPVPVRPWAAVYGANPGNDLRRVSRRRLGGRAAVRIPMPTACTTRAIIQSASVNDLIRAISAFIDGWNERSHPFVWTKGPHRNPQPLQQPEDLFHATLVGSLANSIVLEANVNCRRCRNRRLRRSDDN